MIEINEIIMLLFGGGLILFIQLNLHYLKRIPQINILISSFYVLFAAFVFTILEGFFLDSFFNLLEHICYVLSPFTLLTWCYLVFIRKEAL